VKTAEQCASLDEIRAEIDYIDHSIIELLGRRRGYVEAAAAFKPSASAVAAPDRVAAMMAVRRRWAADEGLSADVVEQIFRALVAYFTAEEQARWSTHLRTRPR
jgi:isochorismate pyruvate lyase